MLARNMHTIIKVLITNTEYSWDVLYIRIYILMRGVHPLCSEAHNKAAFSVIVK